jgi:hypothetical protein
MQTSQPWRHNNECLDRVRSLTHAAEQNETIRRLQPARQDTQPGSQTTFASKDQYGDPKRLLQERRPSSTFIDLAIRDSCLSPDVLVDKDAQPDGSQEVEDGEREVGRMRDRLEDITLGVPEPGDK